MGSLASVRRSHMLRVGHCLTALTARLKQKEPWNRLAQNSRVGNNPMNNQQKDQSDTIVPEVRMNMLYIHYPEKG